jgi:DNA-binding transcriptional LysR family regulator
MAPVIATPKMAFTCREVLTMPELAIQEIKRGRQEIEELTNPRSGVVVLAFLNILGARLIPRLVKEFRERHPDIRFELRQGTEDFVNRQLETGACDLTITAHCSGESGSAWRPFMHFRLDLIVPNRHKWSGRDSIDLKELADEPYIGLSKECALKRSIDEMFGKAGVRPHTQVEAEDLATVAGFVSAGLGVALLPRSEGLVLDGTSWVRVNFPDNEYPVGIEWKEKRYMSPAVRLFRDFVAGTSLSAAI